MRFAIDSARHRHSNRLHPGYNHAQRLYVRRGYIPGGQVFSASKIHIIREAIAKSSRPLK